MVGGKDAPLSYWSPSIVVTNSNTTVVFAQVRHINIMSSQGIWFWSVSFASISHHNIPWQHLCDNITSTSHHITFHYITSHHITYRITSHHITSHHIISYQHHFHRITYRITSHHITSHHITSYQRHITSHQHHIRSRLFESLNVAIFNYNYTGCIYLMQLSFLLTALVHWTLLIVSQSVSPKQESRSRQSAEQQFGRGLHSYDWPLQADHAKKSHDPTYEMVTSSNGHVIC